MKKIFYKAAAIFLLLIGFNEIIVAQITVSGAGSNVDGSYTMGGTYNGKNYYVRSDNAVYILYRTDPKWVICTPEGNDYYFHADNTVTPPNVGWVVGSIGAAPAPVAAGDITSLLVGDGTSGSPYQISSLNSLYWIALNSAEWGKNFVQTANINASETTTWFSGAGWTPIGNFSTYFTGSYNGGSYTIDGLHINRSGTDNQGMFGVIYQGSVQNLGMTNVNITGKMSVGAFTGYLYMNSTMTNCYSTGSVTGESFTAGLAGHVHTNSIVTKCFSSCTINATTQLGGGLVGRFDGSSIENSFFAGTVSGIEYVGGVAGYLYQSTVTNCYSVGAVSGSSSGGLIGTSNSSTVNNSFWDTQTSGKATSAGGTGKTTAEMKTQSTFTDAGWDFEGETSNGTNDYWDLDMPVVYNNGYPFLAWQEGTEAGMPVELVSFAATTNRNGIELTWKTATEINNYGFEVERKEVRVLGLEFSEQNTNSKTQISNQDWVRVGFVEGNGTTNAPKSYNYVDASASGKVAYRLKQIDRDGKFEYSKTVEATAAEVQSFGLEQNYPNPFNPTTMINYQLPMNSYVTLKVYDALGREVASLVNETKEAGTYSAKYDGSKLSSGIYFYTIKAGNFTATKKLTLMK